MHFLHHHLRNERVKVNLGAIHKGRLGEGGLEKARKYRQLLTFSMKFYFLNRRQGEGV